jgi:hypothetical protein
MLKSFLRFNEVNYVIENQDGCISETSEEYYPIPAIRNDVFKFIIEKSTLPDHELVNLRIGLSKCGILQYENVGTISDPDSSGTQYHCSVTIPLDAEFDCYEIMVYSIFDMVDCDQINGLTLQQTIDTGTQLGQVLQCTLNDFL